MYVNYFFMRVDGNVCQYIMDLIAHCGLFKVTSESKVCASTVFIMIKFTEKCFWSTLKLFTNLTQSIVQITTCLIPNVDWQSTDSDKHKHQYNKWAFSCFFMQTSFWALSYYIMAWTCTQTYITHYFENSLKFIRVSFKLSFAFLHILLWFKRDWVV